MVSDLEKYLFEAEGKTKEQLAADNPYREIGFDGEKKRLGWLRGIPFSKIEERLGSLQPLLKHREYFIFVGMGGSINGIKALIALYGEERLHTLDSLDPLAVKNAFEKIKDIKKTLVIPISKSGTTKETQLLATTLKNLFGSEWKEHFLWLTDYTSFTQLDSLGWEEAARTAIQFDEETDIGGRFSCPHTLIFFLPLFLLLSKNISLLRDIYEAYCFLQGPIREKALYYAHKYNSKEEAYFHPCVEGKAKERFSSWVVQLFQESLGSKSQNLAVKTLECFQSPEENFSPLYLEFDHQAELSQKYNDPVVALMSQMYFFQIFVAYYAALKRVAFAKQDYVEKYKEQMRQLEGASLEEIPSLTIHSLIGELKRNVRDEHYFIEVVLYFWPSVSLIDRITKEMKEAFADKGVFIFVGSDWNHHSYEAAVWDTHTFFVFLLLPSYSIPEMGIPKETFEENIYTLNLIAKATHVTLRNKSFLFRLTNPA